MKYLLIWKVANERGGSLWTTTSMPFNNISEANEYSRENLEGSPIVKDIELKYASISWETVWNKKYNTPHDDHWSDHPTPKDIVETVVGRDSLTAISATSAITLLKYVFPDKDTDIYLDENTEDGITYRSIQNIVYNALCQMESKILTDEYNRRTSSSVKFDWNNMCTSCGRREDEIEITKTGRVLCPNESNITLHDGRLLCPDCILEDE